MTESDPAAPCWTQLVVRPAFTSGVIGTAGPIVRGDVFWKKTMMRRPA